MIVLFWAWIYLMLLVVLVDLYTYTQLLAWLTMKMRGAFDKKYFTPYTFRHVLVQIPFTNALEASNAISLLCESIPYAQAHTITIQAITECGVSYDMVMATMQRYPEYLVHILVTDTPPKGTGKGWALNQGMSVIDKSAYDFVAVCDQDAEPTYDWLISMMHDFTTSCVGCIQGRWVVRNARESMVADVAATMLDGHFNIEKRMMKKNIFNGSGGIWNMDTIDQWKETSAEDLDMSVRALRRGWQINYSFESPISVTVPEDFISFCRQQYRWCVGGTDNRQWHWAEMYLTRLFLFLASVSLLMFGHNPTPWLYFGLFLSVPYLSTLPYWWAGVHASDRSFRPIFLVLVGLGVWLPCAWGVIVGLLPGKKEFYHASNTKRNPI